MSYSELEKIPVKSNEDIFNEGFHSQLFLDWLTWKLELLFFMILYALVELELSPVSNFEIYTILSPSPLLQVDWLEYTALVRKFLKNPHGEIFVITQLSSMGQVAWDLKKLYFPRHSMDK